jgi:uncharacterized DUF497 family protein
MEFEWDPAKAQANFEKHGVAFAKAARVFLDPTLIERDDQDAVGERRFNALGIVAGRLLVVTYTMTGDVIRLISARGAQAHERRRYREA